MIEQKSSAKIKMLPFFILSVCIHLFVLFAVFNDGQEKEKFIQIPIDVDFISPIETTSNTRAVSSGKNVIETKKNTSIKEKTKSDIVKIEKNSNKKEVNKKRNEYKEKTKKAKSETTEIKETKKEVSYTNERSDKFSDNKQKTNIDPFDVPSNSGTKGVMFENKNFKFSYYTTSIVKKMRKNWHWSGYKAALRAVVYFKINRDGDVITVRIKESSGSDEFDENALRAVQLSSPFAPLPEAYNENDLGVYFEFKFN